MDRPPAPQPGSIRPGPLPPPLGPPNPTPEESAVPRQHVGLAWHIVLILWMSAFGFLLIYELLTALFRQWKK